MTRGQVAARVAEERRDEPKAKLFRVVANAWKWLLSQTPHAKRKRAAMARLMEYR